MITFSTSCQHSPCRSIFKFLTHLCWPFIHAFSAKFSLLYLFRFSKNMRQSTVTTKMRRNQNLSGCTGYPGFKKSVHHKIVSFSENLDTGIHRLGRRFGEIPCDFLSKRVVRSPKNSFISLKSSSFIPKSYSESHFFKFIQ